MKKITIILLLSFFITSYGQTELDLVVIEKINEYLVENGEAELF